MSLNENHVELDLLSARYDLLTRRLNARYSEIITSTTSENYLVRVLKAYGVSGYLRRMWIGPYNVDLYFPSENLYIEVNGKIHNAEFKMNKDLSKLDYLSSYGIFEYCIENMDVSSKKHKTFFQQLSRSNELASKSNLRSVHELTVSYFKNHKDFSPLRISL